MPPFNPNRLIIAREMRTVKVVAWLGLLGVLLLGVLLIKTALVQHQLLDNVERLLDHVERLERIHFSE